MLKSRLRCDLTVAVCYDMEAEEIEAVVQLPMTWAFWVPANVVTFSIAPHLRTVWSGAAGTLYVGLLSYVAHAYR